MKHFALAGNPNCGKTTLFNSLTGSTAYVGNWPGVTVDKREGTYKKLSEPVSIVDLPGIYSLSPYTPEEVISRNYILEEKPDCVINIIDATNLERNLYLTTQVLEMDVPVVIALNMTDLVIKNKQKINVKELSEKLGVPVVEISALKNSGLNELMKVAYEASKTPRAGRSVLENGRLWKIISSVSKEYVKEEVANPLFHAIKLVENDEIEVKEHKDLVPLVNKAKETFKDDVFGSDFEAVIADERYKFISNNLKDVKVSLDKSFTLEKSHLTVSDKIDRVLTNRWLGIPIFLLILFAIFHITFASDLFYIHAMGVEFTAIPGGDDNTWAGLIVSEDGIASLGVFLQTCLVGLTDWFTGVVEGWMSSQPEWATGFLCDGILAGIFSVLSFLPQILLLFLFFSILEDTGYMARVAFILDRIFRKFGLSGRAFMPMIMGFGCSVPAAINTRTLADPNERTATIRVIPFFSCGAKLPILTAIAGAIASEVAGLNPELVTFGFYVLGMVVAIVSVLVMRNTTMRGEVPPFIMELPSYHVPQFKALCIHLWDKLKHFIKKAFTVILASNILIYFLSHVNLRWNAFLPDEEISNSLLAAIGRIFQPIFTPLGFGSQLGYYDPNTSSVVSTLTDGAIDFGWVFVVTAICGLIAKENVIAVMAIIAVTIAPSLGSAEDLDGIEAVGEMITATGITVPGLLAFISFNMLTIPCFAATATAKAELPQGKFKGTVGFWLFTSYFVSMMIYLIGTWWWTLFIFLAVIGLAIYLIYLYDSKHTIKNLKA